MCEIESVDLDNTGVDECLRDGSNGERFPTLRNGDGIYKKNLLNSHALYSTHILRRGLVTNALMFDNGIWNLTK